MVAGLLAGTCSALAQQPAAPALVPPENAPQAVPLSLDPGPGESESESPLPSRLVPAKGKPVEPPLIEVLPPPAEPIVEGPRRAYPGAPGLASPLPADSLPLGEPQPTLAVSEDLQVWLTQFVLQNIPHEFEDKRQWGKTGYVWDGLKISNDGLQIKTKRRKKQVNDGTWKMYRVELLNPHEEFHVRLENLHDAGRQRAGFDIVVSARVHAFGRMTKYVKGVQLASLSANADASLELRMNCRLGLRLDPSKLLPDVILAPEVTDADLRLTRFHLQDVSDLGGSLARELGHGVRNVLEDKIREERRRLPEKINRQLAKNQDKLRISFSDLARSEWSELTKFLPSGK
jgi:hypothetical protein